MPQPPFELTMLDIAILVTAAALCLAGLLRQGPHALDGPDGWPSPGRIWLAASAISATMMAACLVVTALHLA